jgi:hypothetical protein
MASPSEPNVRRLSYVKMLRRVLIALNQEPDGRWAVHLESGHWPESRTVRASTDEDAAALVIAELERLGEYVPEPPAEFQRSAE